MFSAGISNKDLLQFYEHMESCVEYVSFYQALYSFFPESESGVLLKNMLLKELNKGLKLHEAIQNIAKKTKLKIPATEILAISAGEASGNIAEALREIVKLRKERDLLRSKIRSSFTMPVITLIVALAVASIAIFIIIPKFQNMFLSFVPEEKIPELSKMIFNTCTWIRLHVLYILGGIVAFIFGLKFYVNIWSFPILKKLARLYNFTTLFFNLSLFIRTEYTPQMALDSIYRTLPYSNFHYELRSGLRQVLQRIKSGQDDLKDAFRKTPQFGPIVAFYFELASQTGDYEKATEMARQRFRRLFENYLDIVVSLLNPILFIFTALLVGTLVAAMYIPVFQSVSIIQ